MRSRVLIAALPAASAQRAHLQHAALQFAPAHGHESRCSHSSSLVPLQAVVVQLQFIDREDALLLLHVLGRCIRHACAAHAARDCHEGRQQARSHALDDAAGRHDGRPSTGLLSASCQSGRRPHGALWRSWGLMDILLAMLEAMAGRWAASGLLAVVMCAGVPIIHAVSVMLSRCCSAKSI